MEQETGETGEKTFLGNNKKRFFTQFREGSQTQCYSLRVRSFQFSVRRFE